MKQFASLILLAALLGCSDPHTEGVDAGTGDDASIDAAVDAFVDAGVDAATDASIDQGVIVEPCPEGTLCLRNLTPGGGADAHEYLTVVWVQLSDDGPDPEPYFGYTAPFDRTQSRIDVPLSAIAAPDETLWACPRECDDESVCACNADPKFGMAYVFVFYDADGDGTMINLESAPLSGVAWAYVIYGPEAFDPTPAPYDEYIDRVLDGVNPYVPTNDGSFDEPRAAPSGSVFDLTLCPTPGVSCDLDVPEAT